MSEPARTVSTRSSAPSRSGAPKKTAPTPAPATTAKTAAPSTTAAQRVTGGASKTSTPAPPTKDTVSQDILEANKPVSESTQKLMGSFESNFAAPVDAATRERQEKDRSQQADNAINGNTSWYGNLDEEGLGKQLARRTDDPRMINKTFDKLGDSNRDDVGEAFGRNLSDAKLQDMASTADGRTTLHRVASDLNTGQVYQSEAEQVQRLGQVSAKKHGRLLDDKLPQEVQDSLKANGMTHQKLADGNGRVNFDGRPASPPSSSSKAWPTTPTAP